MNPTNTQEEIAKLEGKITELNHLLKGGIAEVPPYLKYSKLCSERAEAMAKLNELRAILKSHEP